MDTEFEKETFISNLPESYDQVEDEFDDEDEYLAKLDRATAEARFNNTDFYAIFNLNKECSIDDIKEAYKRLSRIFHPDKHSNPQNRQLAQERFQVLQRAYEVLSDPNKRSIYDTYGERALSMPWTIGPLLKTPEQLRQEYERMARKKREEDVENFIKTKTIFETQADFRPFFHSIGLYSMISGINRSNVTRMHLKHSYETQINDNMQLTLTGSMVAQRGRGGGNIGANIRHTISPKLVIEYGMSFIKSRVASIKTFFQPTSDSFINAKTTIGTIAHPPVISATIGRQIGATTTGFMTFNTGEYSLFNWGRHRQIQPSSSLSIGAASEVKDHQYQVEVQVGAVGGHIFGFYKKRIGRHTKLIAQTTLSNYAGISAGIGAEQKVIPKTLFSALLEVGIPAGVNLRLSLTRLGQTLSLPIKVSDEFALKAVVLPSLGGLALWTLFDGFVLRPWHRRNFEKKIKELKELNAEYLENQKSEALGATQLFSPNAAKKLQQEKEKNGLVILQALYGKFDPLNPQVSETAIDVTLAVQNLVLDSQLYISGGHSKSKILGFYDPCFGEPKKLYIRYRFSHQIHEIIVSDTTPLACPQRSHTVTSRVG